MKKFTQIVNEGQINPQEGALNYVSTSDLKKYLEKCKDFISANGKIVINWLIEHPNYIKELGGDKNALTKFVNEHSPKNDEQKVLLKAINAVIKSGRLLEIPCFLTKEQFDDVCDGKVSLDEIVIDLSTEAAKTKIIKKYEPLLNKIVNQYMGKSRLDRDELYSAALVGLNAAMDNYGKVTDKTTDAEKIKQYTFQQYAAQRIRFQILDDIRTKSHTVSIPISAQIKNKKETGFNVKDNTVSGDKVVGSDGENSKTVFDFMGTFGDDADKGTDSEDMKLLWGRVFDEIDKHFSEMTRNIFYSYYGINGHEKMKNAELAKKYGINSSAISYHLKQVNKFIRTDRRTRNKIAELYQLYKECLHDYEMNEPHEPYIEGGMRFTYEDYEEFGDEYNMLYKLNTWFRNNLTSCVGDILLKSVLEMDVNKSKQSINKIMNDTDNPLNKKYSDTIKEFVNYMYDVIDENELQGDISYPDRMVKISKLLGKDNILKATHLNEDKESVMLQLTDILNSTSTEDESFKVLLQYYINHQDDLDNDEDSINSDKDLTKSILKYYKKVYDTDKEIDAYKAIKKMVKDAVKIED